MNTVNGRALKEVLDELQKYKNPLHKTHNGYGYFKTDEYVCAFDDIVGVANYNVEYTDYKYQKISTGQELFSVKCSITIFDDEGKPLIKREGYGGYVCKYERDTKKDVNLQNSPDFVCSYAFKNAAKRFGIFGLKKGIRDTSATNAVGATKSNQKNRDGNVSKETSVINFYAEDCFVQIREDDGRPVYKLNAHKIISDTEMEKETSDIIFYPKQYSRNAEVFNKYVSDCGNGKKKQLRIKAMIRESGQKKTYIFMGFAAA